MRFSIKNVKVNANALKKNLQREIGKSVGIRQESFKVAEQRAKEAKEEMLKNFEASLITKELEAGSENTVNFSGNLNGIAFGEGSLFGFIGFNENDKPIDLVRAYLQMSGKILKTPKKIVSGGKTFYQYKVRVPTMQELQSITPMPWEAGRSWVRAIEKGISGLGYYLLSNSQKSRSGQGIQASKKLRGAAYRPSKYMSSIINSYLKQLQTGKTQRFKK